MMSWLCAARAREKGRERQRGSREEVGASTQKNERKAHCISVTFPRLPCVDVCVVYRGT